MRHPQLAAAVVLAALGVGAASCDGDQLLDIDDDEDYAAALSAAAEIPAPVGSPTATGTATLKLEDRILTVTIIIAGELTSDVTMAHIHGGASTTETAPIALDFVPTMTNVINDGTRTGTIVQASFDLEALQAGPMSTLRVGAHTLVDWLNTGRAYVNVHTVNNPTGELRGQITRE